MHTEHECLVSLFKPEDLIADVFAGVGPFAIQAAKKGCAVLGNDLNPSSAKYFLKNVEDNRVGLIHPYLHFESLLMDFFGQVTNLVRVSCEDGRDFIRSSMARAYDQPFPAYTGPKVSKMQEQRERKQLYTKAKGKSIPSPAAKPARKMISHFVMNLPDSAITFLDAFRGLLVDDGSRDLAEVYHQMPMIHCYCFTRELDFECAERDIRQVRIRVSRLDWLLLTPLLESGRADGPPTT